MKKFILVFTFGLLFAGLSAIIIQAWRIHTYGPRADYSVVPFEHSNPSARLKILFLGDSTIFGTGAKSNTQSTPGWFGQEFSNAHIVNISKNGWRLDGLLETFRPKLEDRYDLIVVQIGANDIIHLTSLPKVKTKLTQLIDRLQPMASIVVILHSGNVGLAPIFTWPFNQILEWRSRQMREIYIQTAHKRGVLYVDLFSERSNDLFLKDINRYYAPDLFHPSGEGYQFWYQRIRQAMNAAGVALRD